MYLSLCTRLFLCVNTGYVHVLVGVEVRTTSAVRPHQGLFVVCWYTHQASEGPMSFGEIACLCLLSQYRSTGITDVHRCTQLSVGPRDSNPHPHTGTASTLPTEPSTQPLK